MNQLLAIVVGTGSGTDGTKRRETGHQLGRECSHFAWIRWLHLNVARTSPHTQLLSVVVGEWMLFQNFRVSCRDSLGPCWRERSE